MTNANENTDYSQGKLYRIVSPNHDKVYIGSTVETLEQRFSKHKQKRDCMSREIIDAGDARIEEIEAFPCLDKYQLEDREAELQLADWCGCVNKMVAGAMRRAGGEQAYNKAYYTAHADEIKAKKKVYREANKEKLRAQRSKKCTCSCGGTYRHSNKARHLRSKRHQKYEAAAKS